ncbi:hypothetical protein RD110_12440 [Rhodoferax koreense]|uniref:HEAT repeat domain-containing protein n=1 Tax=Rhodoferax koreensis TaxID=1842727 RepID=A0A1P8JVX5_9BURK|nr:hypothetical protein [Rhodoferax koreense]APW37903.1 hypothetical protein RD110_12440 [Rhodoferax koreense]
MKWKIALAAVFVGIAGTYFYMTDAQAPTTASAARTAAQKTEGSSEAHEHGNDHPHDHDAPAKPMPRVDMPLNAQAGAVLQQFDRLRSMVPGDAAIALGRQLEAGMTPENAAGYVQALLKADNPAVERSAMAALARSAGSEQILALAGEYSVLPPDSRGRILQTLENVSNPAAVDGLTSIVAADTTEKRSALVMSALYGIANIGTMDSVQYLLGQLSPGKADLALMALERVHTPQGIEIIRAAGDGSKDADGIPPAYRAALTRIAASAGKS